MENPTVVKSLRSLRGPGACQLLTLKSSRVVAPRGVQRNLSQVPDPLLNQRRGLGA